MTHKSMFFVIMVILRIKASQYPERFFIFNIATLHIKIPVHIQKFTQQSNIMRQNVKN